jgi:hypothetical protein
MYEIYSCSKDSAGAGYNQTTCESAGGTWTDDRKFNAPWSQTLFMFIGESFALAIFLIQRRIDQAKLGEDEEQLQPLRGDIQGERDIKCVCV